MGLNKGGLLPTHGTLARGKVWRDAEGSGAEEIVIPDGVRITADTVHWRITDTGAVRIISS